MSLENISVNFLETNNNEESIQYHKGSVVERSTTPLSRFIRRSNSPSIHSSKEIAIYEEEVSINMQISI